MEYDLQVVAVTPHRLLPSAFWTLRQHFFFPTHDTLYVLVENEINTAAWWHCNFSQLTLSFVTVYCLDDFRHALDPRMASDRKGRMPLRFVVGSIHLLFFFLVFKLFSPIPIFVSVFIAAQTAVIAALSLSLSLSHRIESLAVMRLRIFSTSILSAACSVRSLRIRYDVLAIRSIQ